VSNYCHKMKSMTDSLCDLSCIVSKCNLVLYILRGLSKRYNHFRAIITSSTPFPTFDKVQDKMVLEEITLGPDTPMAPRRHSTPTTPLLLLPLLSLVPLAMAVRVKDRATIMAGTTSAVLLAKATRARAASPAPTHWLSFYNPCTETINMYPGLASGGGGN
jgi:hypothetical protein